MLHPDTQARTDELGAAWRANSSLRITPFLRDEIARAVLDELRNVPHQIAEEVGADLDYLCYRYVAAPDPACEHIVCALGRWLYDDGREWIARVTGRDLTAPPDRLMVGTVYGKGCYLDPHNDWNGERSVAYVLGLTEARWPPDEGGWLEFVGPNGELVERRPPGWNTLDVFDVETTTRIHRIPLVTEHHERRAISGWWHRPPA